MIVLLYDAYNKKKKMNKVIDRYTELLIQSRQTKTDYEELKSKYNECLNENIRMHCIIEKPTQIFKSIVLCYFAILQCYRYGVIYDELMALCTILLLFSSIIYGSLFR
jgi:hypothetical protein